MNIDVQARISAKLKDYRARTGIYVKFDALLGELLPLYIKTRRRGGLTYVYGEKGLMGKAKNLKDWQQQVITDVRRELSAADIKAIWKASKLANFQNYS